MAHTRSNSVAVFIPIDDTNWRQVAVNVADIRRQRDVSAHIVVLVRTVSGIGHIDGTTVVHVGS